MSTQEIYMAAAVIEIPLSIRPPNRFPSICMYLSQIGTNLQGKKQKPFKAHLLPPHDAAVRPVWTAGSSLFADAPALSPNSRTGICPAGASDGVF